MHASYAGSVSGGGWFTYYDQMNVFYNDKDGNTRWGVYTLDQTTGQTVNNAGNKDVAFPGNKLTKESVILTSGKANGTMLNYILYSNGSEIRYVNKQENRDYPFDYSGRCHGSGDVYDLYRLSQLRIFDRGNRAREVTVL